MLLKEILELSSKRKGIRNRTYVDESGFTYKGTSIGTIERVYGPSKELPSAILEKAASINLTAKQDRLISGTNLKTINGNSLLGAGNIVLSGTGDMLSTNNLSDLASKPTARTNLGVATTENQTDSTDKRFVSDAQKIVISNTSGINTGDQNLSAYFNKSADDSDDIAEGGVNLFLTTSERSVISSTSGTNSGDNATNTQYSGLAASKQDTLVSATNIKTVNGSSLLGAGNIVISSAASWGTITGTLSSQTDLQSALDAKVTDAAVRGGASTLNDRLNTISNFASPNAGGVVVGQYYDNCFQGSASGTLIGAANRIELAPYYTSVNLPIDRIGCSVSTGVAASTFKIVIYSSGTDGWPNLRLYESADLSGVSAVFAEATLAFTFSSGVQYWVGVRHSSTCTLRTVALASAVNLGLTSNVAANYATVLRRTLAYATPATSPWVFTNTDRVANITPPSIRFRAA